MDSSLSLDELHISFSDHELKFTEPRTAAQREETCDLLREDASRHKKNFERQDTSRNGDFLKADYALTNSERESYDGKLSNIWPATPRKQLKKGKRRDQEFSCIDVDDFAVWEKPAPIYQRNKWSVSNRRDHLPSTLPDRHDWNNDLVHEVESKGNPDSPNSCNIDRNHNLTRGIQTPHSEQNDFTASPRNNLSPRQSFGTSAERRKICSDGHVQEVSLQEKFATFIETEISLIKGGEKISSTQKRRGSALSSNSLSRETNHF